MKSRIGILILAAVLLSSPLSPVIADETSTVSATPISTIQDKFDPLYDVQYERLMVIYKKIQGDSKMLASFKVIIDDFANVRRVLTNSYRNPDSDVIQVKEYAEEELGEFENTLYLLEKQFAKKSTITCIKGKLTKKVTAYSPVCPSGYKKK